MHCIKQPVQYTVYTVCYNVCICIVYTEHWSLYDYNKMVKKDWGYYTTYIEVKVDNANSIQVVG